ncbi:hypothetical protein F503_08511 [Ophiostoma piceae UAMH 11346]|uniref:Uncharacterized protein n=1 Tax=Ophiostoma piceae (strain UAMH 11346) TaxID=1262450 RepID=S3C984_OPHP1|nr:hypothetical protein F503_08511 [Ophiostoma piceae UAMH 11346]
MSQDDGGVGGALEGETEDSTSLRIQDVVHTQPLLSPAAAAAYYRSGCSELDERILGNCVTGGLSGGVVGISSEGDVGISVALQVAVSHLRRDTTATARLVTTLPMEHAVRLLKGVLKGVFKSRPDTNGKGKDKDAKLSILGRVLISRIYAHDDLQAVLGELEAGVPFRRLWSATSSGQEQDTQVRDATDGADGADASSRPASPSIVILTEVDHHFKWMRLQGQGGRVHELYGQLMRRLRALAAAPPPSGPGRSSSSSRPLIFLLNSTLVRVPGQKPEAGFGVYDYETRDTVLPASNQDATYQLALAALQQGRHIGRPGAFRLCCDELARAQCTEPRYRYLMNYYCRLHICLTRLPPDLVDLWAGSEGGSVHNASGESSLWVGNVETDENELGYRMADRFGVVHYLQGFVQDASSA